nr:MAG TPA: Serine/threonine-protein kinase Chk1 [Caudoviricetes sp.]
MERCLLNQPQKRFSVIEVLETSQAEGFRELFGNHSDGCTSRAGIKTTFHLLVICSRNKFR